MYRLILFSENYEVLITLREAAAAMQKSAAALMYLSARRGLVIYSERSAEHVRIAVLVFHFHFALEMSSVLSSIV